MQSAGSLWPAAAVGMAARPSRQPDRRSVGYGSRCFDPGAVDAAQRQAAGTVGVITTSRAIARCSRFPYQVLQVRTCRSLDCPIFDFVQIAEGMVAILWGDNVRLRAALKHSARASLRQPDRGDGGFRRASALRAEVSREDLTWPRLEG